ncbi:MAG: DUF1284 domain-containing protein [Eubacteriales bacterium]|nr:DUF1284 domain-containing protein [Eubacteriales bacterium]
MSGGPIRLRAHHGMCLAFFEGKGYSTAFTAHMQQVLDGIAGDPTVELVTQGDIVCSACPNLADGVCVTAEKVLRYDSQVLALCGLEAHTRLPWSAFSRLVTERILLPRRRESICGDCQWNTICKAREESPNF